MTATRIVLGVTFGALVGFGAGYALWHRPHDTAAAAPVAAEPEAATEPGNVALDQATVQRLGIVTAPLAAATLVPTFAAPGRLVADPSATFVLRAPLPGRLSAGPRELPHIGEAVAADTVVALLLPRLTVAERTDLTQRRAQAAADLAAATAALAAAKQELARTRNLHANGNAASARAVEQAELELQTQTARRDAGEQVLASLPDVGPAGVALTLPRGGVVDDVLAHLGEEVEAGAIVLQLGDPSHLLARIDVPAGTAVDDAFASATLELLGATPTTLAAPRLAWVAGGNGDRAVLLTVTTADGALRPGLPVLAHLPRRAQPLQGMHLPEAAMLRRGDGAWVFVRVGTEAGATTFRRLPVQLDAPAPDGWLATSADAALVPGAELVIGGAGALLSVERQHVADAAEGG
ncbi:MAG: hypothetical protein JNM25_13325 [Planctomycetes bacterium]|nr:hypothetical protein [Planctomycetota bacterium]